MGYRRLIDNRHPASYAEAGAGLETVFGRFGEGQLLSIAFGRVLRIIKLRGVALPAVAVLVALVGCLCGCGSGDATTGAEYVHEPQSQPPAGLFTQPEQAYWSEEEGFAPDAARVTEMA